MSLFFKTLGILGLLLITASIFVTDDKKRSAILIGGGVLLFAYSYHIGDFIFIVLQAVFTVASVYQLIKLSRSKSKLPISVSTDEVIKLETGKSE